MAPFVQKVPHTHTYTHTHTKLVENGTFCTKGPRLSTQIGNLKDVKHVECVCVTSVLQCVAVCCSVLQHTIMCAYVTNLKDVKHVECVCVTQLCVTQLCELT